MAAAARRHLEFHVICYYSILKLIYCNETLALVAVCEGLTKNLYIGSKTSKFKMAAAAILELHKLQYLSHLWTDFA
jgi:hypothetical protein